MKKTSTPKQPLSLDQLKAEVRKMDPALKPNDSTFKSALLMLAGLQIGTGNLAALKRLTGLSMHFIRERAQRLRDNGIWRDGVTACNWFGKDGALAFWLDVTIAEGLLRRA
jgi:hypothetical protein